MSELILELKSKFKSEVQFEEEKDNDELEIKDPENIKMMEDLQLTLQSLNYKNYEIKISYQLLLRARSP